LAATDGPYGTGTFAEHNKVLIKTTNNSFVIIATSRQRWQVKLNKGNLRIEGAKMKSNWKCG